MEKKIPLKNYVILAIIFLVTIIAVFYIRDWYITTKEYYAQNSVMTKVTREIKREEISNYVMENQRLILYVSSGKNSNIKDFEDEFKELIKKLDLNDDVLYMNMDGVSMDSFYEFLKDYSGSGKIKNQITVSDASLYFFDEGRVTLVLNGVSNYSIKRLENIIKNWVIDDA